MAKITNQIMPKTGNEYMTKFVVTWFPVIQYITNCEIIFRNATYTKWLFFKTIFGWADNCFTSKITHIVIKRSNSPSLLHCIGLKFAQYYRCYIYTYSGFVYSTKFW